MAISFDNITRACGTENMAGQKGRVLVIPSCSVKERPALPTNPATDADYVTAAGAYVFNDAVTQHPIYVAISKNTAGYKSDSQGEAAGSRSFKQTGEFFVPMDTVRVAAFARQVHNQECDIVFERPDGSQVVMFLADVKPACDLGKAPSDKSGYTFMAEADHFVPRIFLGTPIDMDALIEES